MNDAPQDQMIEEGYATIAYALNDIIACIPWSASFVRAHHRTAIL